MDEGIFQTGKFRGSMIVVEVSSFDMKVFGGKFGMFHLFSETTLLRFKNVG